MTTPPIHPTIRTHAGDYAGSVSVPTFYLDGDVQGIVSADHAAEVATAVVNADGVLDGDDIDVRAYPVDPGRYSHIVRRASGAVVGWHRSAEDAERCADACNAIVPADHAAAEALEDEDVWRAL